MQGLDVSPSWQAIPESHPLQLREHHVQRAALSARLHASRYRLNLLCAPAGYGKSVLLREAFGSTDDEGVLVWIALAGNAPNLSELSLQLLEGFGLSPSAVGAPATLLRHFAQQGEPLHLVLDDLPAELSIETNHWFEQVLGLPRSRLRLSVSCRQRPAWNLPKLLLQGELLELDADNLSLDRDAFDRFCAKRCGGLDAGQLDLIWRRSGGWWAGASLLLAERQGRAALVAQYLAHEVLPRLGAEERELLFALCHLPRFSADLCAQLREGQSGAQLLHRLIQQQAFIQALEGNAGWYRVHPLVAEALQDRLDPQELARLRLHSCRLLSVAGHLNEAIEQALRAEQPEVAATYMERLQPSWQLTDRDLHRVLEWRSQLPAQLLESTPRLIYLGSLSLLFSGRLSEAQSCMEAFSHFLPAADAAQQRRLLAHAQTLRGCLHAHRGEPEAAAQACRDALEHLGPDEDDWLSVVLCRFVLSRLLVADGRQVEARQLLLGGIERARALGCLDSEALLQGDLLRLMLLRGELEAAQALLEENLQWRRGAHLEPDPLLGRLLFVHGELLGARGLADEAERAFSAGLEQTRNSSAPFLLQGYLGLAEAAVQTGNINLALRHLHQAERRMQLGRIDPRLYRPALDLQHLRIHAAQQNWEALLQAAEALSREYPMAAAFAVTLPPTLAIESHWWLAVARARLGAVGVAVTGLRGLREMCDQRGLQRLSREVRGLLESLGDRDEEIAPPVFDDGARHLPGALQEDLTPRESAVLSLLADGLSNQEIADALFLSVNTVKYHAKNINGKLGTSRRTQAIACAKHLGLIV